MSNYSAAIGRQHGKVDTDNNGLTRFMLKIEVPQGIKSGNEPDLSLQYSQATPNGIIGVSWALGGVSSIHLGAPKVVYDKLNPPPPDYDSTKPNLIMDGTDLLNIAGAYHGPNTVYTTETDNTGLTLTSLGDGKGFMARDNMGRSTEYGTTTDSRVFSTSLGTIREWRVKRQTDCHGNTVVYNYIASPQASGTTQDANTSYLSSIKYCSNSVTKALATRFIKFDYKPRPDLIKQSVEGDIVTWANLLSVISLGTEIAGTSTVTRSYSLSYKQSPTTGNSCLSQVMESADNSGQGINLLPATFTYTVPGVDPATVFKTVPADPFSAEANVFSLIPLNLTGRALADMACLVWDQSSKTLTVKTYVADRNADATVSWTPSQKDVSLIMPNWDPTQQGVEMPDFMTPDLHGDGRSDLIVPFSNAQGNLEFFLSQSNGVGLTAGQKNAQTAFPWVAQSKFKAMDMTGTGVVDVVQIYQKESKLCFRNFPGVADNAGSIGLGEAVETDTQYSFDNTIDWFLLRQSGTGATSLVRVWQEFLASDPNQYNIKTTSFRCAKVFDSSKGFDPAGRECIIGGPFTKEDPSAPQWSVLTCDINGDGTQDIVLGKALHTPADMTFTFQVSLGDGLGGFLKVSEITKVVLAPEAKGDGMFSVTNINGGLYPSLAYVYQRKDDNSFVCLSADGHSDGTMSDVTQYPVTPDPGKDQIQVIPVDLSGTGMGGWLLYSLTNGVPAIVPVYNTAQPTDLLHSAENPMGLVSTVSYGTLSDVNVYNSTVDWKNYTDIETANYVVQGAPNYVVTSLRHTNNPNVNSVAFDVNIQKTYTKAIVNSQGRGWLGFESINTTNLMDSILTVEHYFQEFPKIGMKSKIETFAWNQSGSNQLLQSQTTDYDPVKVPTNAWNIFHVNKMFDKVETDGPNGRVQLTEFNCDESGNVTSKHSSETQAGIVVYQAWERCTYVTVKGMTGLLSGKKLTPVEANTDVNTFQAGDTALTHYTYDNRTALLSTELHWSDDAGKFLTTTYEFDTYGNETSKTDPAGLTTETTYDSTFNNLAIQRIEKGVGVLTTQYTAYDQATGEVVARLDTDGRLICIKVDNFGRSIETRMASIAPGKSSVRAVDFFGQQKYVAFSQFAQQLSTSSCLLDPFEKTSYTCFNSAGGKAYLTATTLSFFNEDDSGQHEVVQVLDCSEKRAMQRSRQGVDPANNNPSATRVSWEYWKYDTRGNTLYQSFPLQSAAWNNFEYQPTSIEVTTSQFDALGRIILQTRPSHNDTGVSITSSLTYTTGGGTVTEKIVGPDPNIGSKDAQLWSAPRRYVSIDGKEHVIASTTEDGLVSEFTYDISGNVTLATDPNGKKETRVYNSLGQLRVLDNDYQKMVDPAKPSSQPAMTYEYDGLGQLCKITNANEEVTTFERDCKGRPVRKTGFDGRLLEYQYDLGGREGLSMMTVYPEGHDGPMETKLSFKYDNLGRLSSRILTFADGTGYETSMSYDWQGQVTSKTYPNGAVKSSQYIGSLPSYSQVYHEPASGQRETWLDSRFEYTDATGKPNNIMVGQASMESDFYHSFTYDLQSFPLTHALDQKLPSTGQAKNLVQEGYTYNGADQLAQRSQKTTTAKYNYDGKRLKNSQIGDQPVNNYVYDKAGNLLTKAETTITYSSNGAHGISGNETVFDILYDRAGRLVNRSTQQESLDFNYNSFGLLASYTDSAQTKTTLICGPDGKTVRRDEPDDAGSIILISDDYNVRLQADGSRITTLKLFGAGILLGSFSKMEGPNEVGQAATVLFTDTKGNVTYKFKGLDASLVESIAYDDFGEVTITTAQSGGPASDKTSTYESKRLDEPTGLLDFGSRWYDPLVGRFTTPDNVLEVKNLARSDGLNRLAFENNDPINHTDPSGHWSLSAFFGAVVGAALVVGAIALTVATGGAAAPLAAAAVGAMASGGIAGITYSFDHRNERGGKFWGGYAATVLVNAAIGGASGALGAVATPARIASATGRLGQAAGWSLNTSTQNLIGRAASVGGKALISATSSLLNTVAHNAVENQFYGAHNGLFDGAGKAFAGGAVSGAVTAGISAWKFTGESTAMSKAEMFKSGRNAGAAIAARAGWAVTSAEHVPERAAHHVKQEVMETYHVQQTKFKALSQMVGPSGFVGTLNKELHRNQSFVNYG